MCHRTRCRGIHRIHRSITSRRHLVVARARRRGCGARRDHRGSRRDRGGESWSATAATTARRAPRIVIASISQLYGPTVERTDEGFGSPLSRVVATRGVTRTPSPRRVASPRLASCAPRRGDDLGPRLPACGDFGRQRADATALTPLLSLPLYVLDKLTDVIFGLDIVLNFFIACVRPPAHRVCRAVRSGARSRAPPSCRREWSGIARRWSRPHSARRDSARRREASSDRRRMNPHP